MLWGAFNNSSAAMIAMSHGMDTLSQNIANMNTNGYKRLDTQFKTVLSETHAAPAAGPNGLSIFGVRPTDRTLITQQGMIATTGNWTDLGINGRGFFVVANPDSDGGAPSSAGLDDTSATLFTRDGGFGRYAVGDNEYFVTNGGQFLMGWQADDDGVIAGEFTSERSPTLSGAAVAAGGGGGTLSAVYTDFNTTIPGLQTSLILPVVNLPSTLDNSGVAEAGTATITDPFGASHTLNINWSRTGDDTWDVTYSFPASDTDGVAPATATAVTLDSDGNVSVPAGGLDSVSIDWTAIGGGVASSSVDLDLSAPSLSTTPLALTVYDAEFESHNITAVFEKSSANTWNLRVQVPTADGTVTSTTQPITFDGAGQVLTPAALTTTIDITWASANGGTSSITMDLSKITQFADSSGKIAIKTIDQDGYGSGNMIGADFSKYGELIGRFDNGHARTLFKVPVASFVAADSLESISGTLFRRTAEAGEIDVASIDSQGSGAAIVSGAVETSNVDLQDEFTRMIVTQKAYSSNATVFRTADEMTTVVRDLMS